MVMEILDEGAFWRQWNTVKMLKVSRINNKIPPSKWLSKMDHRQAIANTFQMPVFFLSVEEYLLFVPTTTAFKDWNSKLDPIYLMLIKGNHWFLVLLKVTDRSKPIPPVIGSTKLSSEFTCVWRSDLKDCFLLDNQDLQPIKKI
ncbi:hypothetical protein VP01_448g9 [Puccinia sorghi]|uniref:Ubiquitin-like protease family profile domain-containing protein n=1 Tax=Puccinia sorghi TaxID=27349 RepID=A0A0L6UP64_9BASI|nr:hypothetical protein VP01_448g9 [Puccinia sorghi]